MTSASGCFRPPPLPPVVYGEPGNETNFSILCRFWLDLLPCQCIWTQRREYTQSLLGLLECSDYQQRYQIGPGSAPAISGSQPHFVPPCPRPLNELSPVVFLLWWAGKRNLMTSARVYRKACVVVSGREQTLFCCKFQSRYCV